MIKRLSKIKVEQLLEKNNWSVLDIGCGYSANKYANVICDTQDLKNFYKDKKFVRLSDKILPFRDNEFDFVVASHVLEHVQDPVLFLSEIQRVSKNSYVMVESYRNEKELFNLQCWALTCESFFSKKEWEWLFKEFGYNRNYEFIYFE